MCQEGLTFMRGEPRPTMTPQDQGPATPQIPPNSALDVPRANTPGLPRKAIHSASYLFYFFDAAAEGHSGMVNT